MVIVNGNMTSTDSILLDSGYNFGRGVFETIMVCSKPLFLKQHCERLKKGLAVLNIGNSVDEQYIMECIKKYNIGSCVLKVVVTERNIVVSTRTANYKAEDYIRGFNIKLSNMRRNPYSHVTYLKSLNYTDNIIEKERAAKEGYDEVLFLNTRDELAEGSVSNVFFVKEGKIFTPEISCGILDGIVREWVINNFEVAEGKFSLDDIKQADELFITNSIMGVMKVKRIEGIKDYSKDLIYNSVRDRYLQYISK